MTHKYCKGCVNLHNAGHRSDSQLAKTYNNWCTAVGKTCKDAIGFCKLNKLKKEKS